MSIEFFIIKKRKLQLLKDIFKKSDIVLDVGCGVKPNYHEILKAKVVCVDIKHTKKTHLVADALSLPIKKQKFDGIICIDSFYYYGNPFKAIKELSHVLKKNGKFVMITPFMYPIHDVPDDKYRFTEYGIREILKEDFDIKQIKPVGGIFNIPAVFFHSLIKGIPLMVPKPFKDITKVFSTVIFFPFYILAQLFSYLDFLDVTGRWPTYYFTVAIKK